MQTTRFVVKHPKGLCGFMLFTWLVILIVPVAFTVFQGPLPIAAYCIFLLLGLPFFLGMIWMKVFRVDVDGEEITVRRGIGSRYGFRVAEIERVVYIIKETGMGTSRAIQIFVGRHKLAVSNMLEGADALDAYVQEFVSKDKIEVIERRPH